MNYQPLNRYRGAIKKIKFGKGKFLTKCNRSQAKMCSNEAETRMELIDPELRLKGWNISAGTLRLETTLGTNGFNEKGQSCKLNTGRSDYLLQIKTSEDAQPIAIAFIEAKKRYSAVTKGLEQAIRYARYHHMQYIYSCNGDQFVEYNCNTGMTGQPQPMAEFPSHAALLSRYQALTTNPIAKHSRVLTIPYFAQQAASVRYYQDAAIRAVLEKIALCEKEQKPKRALLSLATGTGKTFIAANLLKRISEAGLLEKALFICDRDELRTQGHAALSRLFSSNAQMVTSSNAQKNAKVLVATYQTLGVEDDNQSSFLLENYPENYFSHIVIDECHRSGFGKWSTVLKRNPNAVQIGLTATPRKIKLSEKNNESLEDEQINADNYKHFGEPVYEYDLLQAVEDGYLSACEIVTNHILLFDKNENEGLLKQDLLGINATIKNYFSGQEVTDEVVKDRYHPIDLDRQIVLPERTQVLSKSLFDYLQETGKPEQKTIIFCASVDHARRVAIELNNLYAQWCINKGQDRLDSFAFPCTAAEGKNYISDLKEAKRSHFIACTADLLQAGVDVPWVRNIVFFAHIKSAIRFYQMVGRGTRLHAETEKISFKIYDYTNATRLFGEEFISAFRPVKYSSQSATKELQLNEPQAGSQSKSVVVQVSGINTIIQSGETFFVLLKDGKDTRVNFAEYRQYVKELILERLPTVNDFVQVWIDNPAQILAISEVQTLLQHKNAAVDSFDVIADVAYDIEPKTKQQRLEHFLQYNEAWLVAMPEKSASTLRALAEEFKAGGTEGLNNKEVFNVRNVINASGGSAFSALRLVGRPPEIFREFKSRIFSL